MNSTPTVQELVEGDIFEVLGMQELSDEDKKSLVTQMLETVQARVYTKIYQQLDEEEQQEINTIGSDRILTYLMQKGFDVMTMVIEEGVRYRLELIAVFKGATQQWQQQS